MIKRSSFFEGATVIFAVFILLSIPAWITHVFVTIKALLSDETVGVGYGALLGLGVFVPPVGVLHGWMIWLGAV